MMTQPDARAGGDDLAMLREALECYRKRNGKMRVCVDYPTARCSAADCARTGCAKVYQLTHGVRPAGLPGERGDD